MSLGARYNQQGQRDPSPLSRVWMNVNCEMVNREMGLQKALLPKIRKLLMWTQSFSEAPLGTWELQTIKPHLSIRTTDRFREGQTSTTQIRQMWHEVSA